MMIELHERIAAMEQRISIIEETNNRIETHVASIDAHFNKQKGVIGAIWFTISCIGVFLSAFKYFHKG